MPRSEKRYHFLYKTTNIKNGNYYLGMHSTSKLDDGYLGSGTRLRRSIRKHGKDKFKLEILKFFESREDLIIGEKNLITEEVLKDPKCMNLVFGGNGGFISESGYKKGAKKMLDIIWNDPEFRKRHSKNQSELSKKLWKSGICKYKDYWTGRKHKEETKKKIGKKNALNIGNKNSQFGTMWITNGQYNKKIKKGDNIPENWYKGRKINKNSPMM